MAGVYPPGDCPQLHMLPGSPLAPASDQSRLSRPLSARYDHGMKSPSGPASATGDRTTGHRAPDESNTLSGRVLRVINAMRPAVQNDGGDIELVEVTPSGVVKIRFHGACVGCPSSAMTLKMGIERNLKEYVPEVTAVQAVD